MRISDFDYELPDELIARYPTAERRASRLLEVGAQLADRQFADLPALLGPGDLLVFNDTRVIPARLAAAKETGGRVEVLIERIDERDPRAGARAREQIAEGGSGLRLAGGEEIVVAGRDGEFFVLEFSKPVLPLLERRARYHCRRTSSAMPSRRMPSATRRSTRGIPAPSRRRPPGLHFDRQMLDETLAAGVQHAFVTLHVGAGTFQTLRHEHVEENRLHSGTRGG